MREQGELAFDGSEERVSRTRERDEERVALRVDLVSAVSGEGGAEQSLMVRKHAAVPLAELLDEPRRPFDVGEEEGDGAGGRLRHAAEA